MSLRKRRNLRLGLQFEGPVPDFKQLVTMKRCPFDNQSQYARWKAAANNYQALNFHNCLIFTLLCVEEWRQMITKVHPDDDAKEAADFRHVGRSNLLSAETSLPVSCR